MVLRKPLPPSRDNRPGERMTRRDLYLSTLGRTPPRVNFSPSKILATPEPSPSPSPATHPTAHDGTLFKILRIMLVALIMTGILLFILDINPTAVLADGKQWAGEMLDSVDWAHMKSQMPSWTGMMKELR